MPAYYREVYDIVCPNPRDGKVDQDMFVKILVKSSLPKQTLSSVSFVARHLFCLFVRRKIFKTVILQYGLQYKTKTTLSFMFEGLFVVRRGGACIIINRAQLVQWTSPVSHLDHEFCTAIDVLFGLF